MLRFAMLKNIKKIIRNYSHLIDDFASFEDLLPKCDEAMVSLKLYNLALALSIKQTNKQILDD